MFRCQRIYRNHHLISRALCKLRCKFPLFLIYLHAEAAPMYKHYGSLRGNSPFIYIKAYAILVIYRFHLHIIGKISGRIVVLKLSVPQNNPTDITGFHMAVIKHYTF